MVDVTTTEIKEKATVTIGQMVAINVKVLALLKKNNMELNSDFLNKYSVIKFTFRPSWAERDLTLSWSVKSLSVFKNLYKNIASSFLDSDVLKIVLVE